MQVRVAALRHPHYQTGQLYKRYACNFRSAAGAAGDAVSGRPVYGNTGNAVVADFLTVKSCLRNEDRARASRLPVSTGL